MIQEIYFRRRRKFLLPELESDELLPLPVAVSLSINLESLGYCLDPETIEAVRKLTVKQIATLQAELVKVISESIGDHVQHRPMYVNFPKQVIEMDKALLYVNAMVHYWSEGLLFPVQHKKLRAKLWRIPVLQYLSVGSQEDFDDLVAKVIRSNVAFSATDAQDIKTLIQHDPEKMIALIPERIPIKENMAAIGVALHSVGKSESFLRAHVRTATDLLRFAVAMSGGDVSLAVASKFAKFSRPTRRLILEILDSIVNPIEDMMRRPERWKRLGEKLHPGEFADKYYTAYQAFLAIRKNSAPQTFNGKVENSIRNKELARSIETLRSRPGEYVRRLDHLLRSGGEQSAMVLDVLSEICEKVSTPVLLQSWHHFRTRNVERQFRSFFPKGQVAKLYAKFESAEPLHPSVAERATSVLEQALVQRFSQLSPLGTTFVDPDLARYPIPFATRSASKALRTLPKGSRVPLPAGDILRFFIWWKNGSGRTDIDLSAALFGDDYLYLDVLSYYNLVTVGGCHSGDIVDAPEGASEFIDISVSKCLERNVRYVAMVLTGFTPQKFCDLPECFAGWMSRIDANSGEIYDPRTVQDKMDLAADSRIGLPIVFDLLAGEAIWCDMALKTNPRYCNHVDANQRGIALTIRAMAELNKPTLYDLLGLHQRARGMAVSEPGAAETTFSVELGTQFELERIAAEFMA